MFALNFGCGRIALRTVPARDELRSLPHFRAPTFVLVSSLRVDKCSARPVISVARCWGVRVEEEPSPIKLNYATPVRPRGRVFAVVAILCGAGGASLSLFAYLGCAAYVTMLWEDWRRFRWVHYRDAIACVGFLSIGTFCAVAAWRWLRSGIRTLRHSGSR
jgi:hypothetical protein